jgi:hypothetical protein
MSKLLLALLASALLLVMPSVAQAKPWRCRMWAKLYTHSPVLHRTFNRAWRRALHPPYVGRARAKRKVQKGIYDWAVGGYINKSWCDRNKKVCRALKACLLAVAFTEAQRPVLGLSWWKTQIAAAGACGEAAAITMATT